MPKNSPGTVRRNLALISGSESLRARKLFALALYVGGDQAQAVLIGAGVPDGACEPDDCCTCTDHRKGADLSILLHCGIENAMPAR